MVSGFDAFGGGLGIRDGGGRRRRPGCARLWAGPHARVPGVGFLVDILAIASAIALLLSVLVIAGVVLLRRANEVSRRHRVGAPVRWMGTPTRPAMLHRRLRAAVDIMRTAVPPPRHRRPTAAVDDLASEVEALAAALDRELILLARQPMAVRTNGLVALSARTTRIEALAARVARIGRADDPSRPTEAQWDERATMVHHRIEAIRDAQREVSDLERQLGLG
jgi:hypothetical protein